MCCQGVLRGWHGVANVFAKVLWVVDRVLLSDFLGFVSHQIHLNVKANFI